MKRREAGQEETLTASHPLSAATLDRHADRVAVPSYDRAALVPAVVHMSVGYFHRAHQAVYLDDLARTGERGWGLVGVGLRRPQMHEALTSQDCLYTVVERGADGDRARIVGAMQRYLFAPWSGPEVVEALADARTRLVTLTVTAAAYEEDAWGPRSAVGFLVEGLARRRRRGLGGFTVLSCDNLPANGEITRGTVLSFAALRDPALAAWTERNVTFPSSMVDRITPKTTAEDRARLAAEFGVEDRWPVMTEPYSAWIVEDAFCNGRPPLEQVGVRFVGDVRPYALVKTRTLNATHCALGHLGLLAGHERTDEAMLDPVLGEYAARLMAEEVAPLLPAIAGVDHASYRRSVLARLRNPKIGDQLARLSRGGSLKVPRHVMPSLAQRRAAGAPHALLTLAVAGFCAHVRSGDELDDPARDRLRATADDLPRLLADRSLFGDLAGDRGFAAEIEAAVRSLEVRGVRATVAAALHDEPRVAA